MKITCNNELQEIENNLSLENYIESLDLNPDTVVAECDGQIVKREDYVSHILKDGEVVELIRFVGGG